MIYSMTGFGSGRIETPKLKVTVEVKTVNHRYLDVHVRLPIEFQSLERVVRKAVSDTLKRGRIDLFVKIDLIQEKMKIEANPALISSYVDLMAELKTRFSIDSELTLETISKLPGAVKLSNQALTSEEVDSVSEQLEEATLVALEEAKEMRAKEGASLVNDMNNRAFNIRKNLEVVENHAEILLQHHRESLLARVSELAPDVKIDGNRLEVEALICAEKSDISEETTRLESHLDQFEDLKMRDEESGKRMDFLLQEMNREVTTILSKTSGLAGGGMRIGEAAIEIKVEIDKLREQAQNIE